MIAYVRVWTEKNHQDLSHSLYGVMLHEMIPTQLLFLIYEGKSDHLDGCGT